MKSRQLLTTNDLIASNYIITPALKGKFWHTFTPANTATVYGFEAKSTPVITEGERYNVGYTVNSKGQNIVDLSALSKASEVNPMFSFFTAQQIAREHRPIEKAKNDQRVTHSAKDGYYWGKKYAWRMFGTVIPQNAFYQYLAEIEHPSVSCITSNPDLPYQSNGSSVAYKEDGLEEAMTALISSAKKVFGPHCQRSLHYAELGMSAAT